MARERKQPEAEPPREERSEVLDDGQEIHDEDFQFALKELLAAYEPILVEELDRVRAPELKKRGPRASSELRRRVRAGRTNLRQVFQRGRRRAPATTRRPAAARPDRGGRWCLRHIRCCII